MYQSIFYTIVRGTITYFFVLLLTRIMGRKLISQMTFFDFVIGVSLGSLSANMAMGSDNTSTTTAVALSTITALAVLTGIIHIKSIKVRNIINSEPVTLIDSGNIVEDNMKRIRLTINELTMKLRKKNVFSLADVEFAILETDGQLSVLPKPDKAPLTPSHMNIQASSGGLMRDIVIDGNVMEENLNSAGLNAQWLQAQLQMQGIGDASDLFYAGVDANKKLYVSKRNAGNAEGHGKYGIE